MNYSQTIIDQVSELAANLTPPGDIAVLLDLDPDELNVELSLKDSPLRRAYLKAKATTALMLRRQEIDLARVGFFVSLGYHLAEAVAVIILCSTLHITQERLD